ncbi:MAG: DDE-type integrase/transposase/recombinase [Methylocystis sp.]|uniref:DDE-type integrase/transposase/recombinase n=1 Tax=Methylocystis sp. TaxID=1911079 RepID=UPI003DA23541
MYRAVDKGGATVDFLLAAKRDRKAAFPFPLRAIDQNGTPKRIATDNGGGRIISIDVQIRNRDFNGEPA